MAIPEVLIGETTVDLWPTAGRLCGLSKNSTYRAAHAGEIPVLKFGGKYVVPVLPLLKLLGFEEASMNPGPINAGVSGAVDAA